jgi:hypothetical protein
MLWRGRHVLVVPLVAVFVLGLTATLAGAQSDEPQVSDPSVLAVLDAKKGTFDSASGKVTLSQVAPRAIWFTDRPARQTGAYTLPQLLSTFFDGQPPPNAALEFEGADEKSDVTVVQVSDPKYDGEKNQLIFTAKIVGDPTTELRPDTALADFVRRHDGKIPKSFGSTRLFIDSARPDGAKTPNASDLTEADGTVSSVDPQGLASVNFSDDDLKVNQESITVDCTQVAGTKYVARAPGDDATIFDSPYVKGTLSPNLSVGSSAEAYVEWGHLFSRLATKIKVTVTNDKYQDVPEGKFNIDIYCASDQSGAWVIASLAP